MDDAGPPSLFVVVSYGFMDPPYFSILQLDHPVGLQLETAEQMKKNEVNAKEYIIKFNQQPPRGRPRIRWLFSPPTSSSEDLYMVPNWGFGCFKPLHGYKINFTTGSSLPIKPPNPYQACGRVAHLSKGCGLVANLGGHIYFLSDDWYYDHECPVFQCYDPNEDSWQSLKPFPHPLAEFDPILATAVLGDTILFNMSLNYSSIWAYNVTEKEWYSVDVDDKDKQVYDIVGEAVVVGDTIYALTDESSDLVIALSIEKKLFKGDLVFRCFIVSQHCVRGMGSIDHMEMKKDACDPRTGGTKHLVHLSQDYFCLVQSWNTSLSFNINQDIQLTYIELKGKYSRIVRNFTHKVKLQPPGRIIEQFQVLVCFSLPKSKTTALEEGKRFNLDPFPADYVTKLVQDEDEDEDEHGDGDGDDSAILEVVAESQATPTKQAEVAKSELNTLKDRLMLVEDMKNQLGDSIESEAQAKELVGETAFQLQTAKMEGLEPRSDGIKTVEAYDDTASELEQSRACVNRLDALVSEVKVQKDYAGGNESQPIGDPSEPEVMSLKSEVDPLIRAALEETESKCRENKTQGEMQLKSTYEMVEQSESSFSAREAELESEIQQQSRLQIEQLKENLMDKETESQGIQEEKEELNVELASKGESDYEKKKLKAERLKESASKGEPDYEKEKLRAENESTRKE